LCFLGTASAGGATQFVLVLRSGGGEWRIEEVEKVSFNNKDKLRVGSAKTPDLKAEEYKRLPAQPMLHAEPMRRDAAGRLVRKSQGVWVPVVPDGLSIKASATYAALWAATNVTSQKDRAAKTSVAVPVVDIFAILPGTDRNETLANFVLDTSNFRGLGEKDADAAMDEQMLLLAATARVATGPAADRVRLYLLTQLQAAGVKVSSGLAKYDDLLYGLKLVGYSAAAYPDDIGHKNARDALTAAKSWLDMRMAVLKAFAAGELWDPLLDKYGEFERWDQSFPEIQKARERAYRESVAGHLAEAIRLHEEKRLAPALREIEMARLRSPGNAEIENQYETVRIEEARANSKACPAQLDPKSPTAGRIRQLLRSSDNFIADGQLDDARAQIAQAEKLVDADWKKAPAILLGQAKLQEAAHKPLDALKALDDYDRCADAVQDIQDGEDLRGKIVYNLKKNKDKQKADIAAAEKKGDYAAALALADAGLELDNGDPDFLLAAGIDSAITRKNTEAEALLNRYLEVSRARNSAAAGRQSVYEAIPKVAKPVREPEGASNWFSGYKSPAGTFYCPISLTFNVRPSAVHGTRNQTVAYTWKGEALQSIQVANSQPGEKSVTVYFDYYPNQKTVRRVSTEPFKESKEPPAPVLLTPSGPVGPPPGAYTALLNHPAADPLMIQKLTGKAVGAVITGNPYFHPFVWTGVFLFLVEYDDQGRVKSANQQASVDTSGGQPGALHSFDFTWDGPRLMEIAERGAGGYRRTMTYGGGKLLSETIVSNAVRARIDYKYNGDRLVEADCSEDPTLDHRGRRVTF
jgi:hypothetical protein